MHWTQEKYKTDVLIELSTLTGAIIFALGHKHAGLFSNHETLAADLMAAGQEVHEESWRMPLTDYHRDLVKHREADITNSSGKTEAGSAQAAAFLENFVEQGTKWVHLDIAGTSIVAAEGTGYGAKILLQYARNYAENNWWIHNQCQMTWVLLKCIDYEWKRVKIYTKYRQKNINSQSPK